MIKILTVIGARPQFIKASAFSRACAKYPEIEEVIVHTGQHFDENMSAVFFNQMNIPEPKYNLGINSMKHAAMTASMMTAIEGLLEIENPDMILVYGDTNSTLAAALVASKLPVKLAHVEAGLRSFNNEMPEEINRILTDRVSDILFCPSQAAVDNLMREGYAHLSCEIVRTGDIMLDSALHYAKHATAINQIPGLADLGDDFVLTTIHRAENTASKSKLEAIFGDLSEINKSVPVVLPIHPRTKGVIEAMGISIDFKTIDPVGYLEMLSLIKNARAIITDSGGLQKEAYFFEKQCLTVRDQTEWVELVELNCNQLVETVPGALKKAFAELNQQKPDFSTKLYGDGAAGKSICEAIITLFKNQA